MPKILKSKSLLALVVFALVLAVLLILSDGTVASRFRYTTF